MIVRETPRILLRHLTIDDAPYVHGLVNEPSFHRWIGDRGVRTLADAERYLREGPIAGYARDGHGLNLVVRRADGAPIGMCGLLRRPALDEPDLGFAFTPAFWGQGYAREAALAARDHGLGELGLPRFLAITLPENRSSIAVLEAIGMRDVGEVRLAGDAEVLRLYRIDRDALGPTSA